MVAEHGFQAIETASVCARAQVSGAHFDRCFADLEDCFLAIHDEALEELCERVRAVSAERESWHDRLWAAGTAAMRFLRENPVRARFLVVSVSGSGDGAAGRRDRVVGRIADILDGGRGEGAGEGERRRSRCTAEIAAGAVYNTLFCKIEGGAVERGEEFLPELIYLATMPYLGQRVAEDELAVQPLR